MNQAALELAKGMQATPRAIAKVAKEVGEEDASWAFTQWELRRRARAKFVKANEMLFLREALEQATHEKIAEFHATLFPPQVLVADLTTGIGSDLIALARRGMALGYELEQERAELAKHNVEVHGLVAEVRVQDCLVPLWEFDYAFADPARRVEGRRTLKLEEFSPDPVELSRRMSRLKMGVLKLTPMLSDQEIEALGSKVVFASFGGECREVLVITGTEAETWRGAAHVESGEWLESSKGFAQTAEEPEQFFFEADPAAIRAHCLASFGLKALGNSNGYLTGTERRDSVWLKRYRVLYSGKGDTATTRGALRELGAAKPVLKQRGADLDLQRLAREFKAFGSRAVYLAVWPVGRSLKHTILEEI
jgi:hypothetical protein